MVAFKKVYIFPVWILAGDPSTVRFEISAPARGRRPNEIEPPAGTETRPDGIIYPRSLDVALI